MWGRKYGHPKSFHAPKPDRGASLRLVAQGHALRRVSMADHIRRSVRMPRLQGKNALVTGASSGIGQAIAIRFAEEGANVAINYNSGKDRAEDVRKRADKAARSIGGSTKNMVVQGNIAKDDQVQAMFKQVLGEFGRLDILINNSGIQKAVASDELEAEEFDRIIGVNLRGA